jgi:hypothetical protein
LPLSGDKRKYCGGTLFRLRVVLQNRRTDGKVAVFYLSASSVLARPLFEEVMLPEQKAHLERFGDGPWVHCSTCYQQS